jgi:hypothetical protein
LNVAKKQEAPTEKPKLRGTLVEKSHKPTPSAETPEIDEKKVEEHIAYLNEVVAPLAKEHGGFMLVLGGQSPLSMEGAEQLAITKFREPENVYVVDPDIRAKQIAKAWNTGSDLNTLIREFPNDRYKFYFSLDLSSPDKTEKAQEMFGKILEQCKEQKISLLSKTEDHTYDSLDLFTWDQQKLAGVIREVYSQYPDIWKSTHHFFQAPVDEVNPMHVGWVQEPIGGKNGSHSSRMGLLGVTLDMLEVGAVNAVDYKRACKNASVRPDAPWLIAA